MVTQHAGLLIANCDQFGDNRSWLSVHIFLCHAMPLNSVLIMPFYLCLEKLDIQTRSVSRKMSCFVSPKHHVWIIGCNIVKNSYLKEPPHWIFYVYSMDLLHFLISKDSYVAWPYSGFLSVFPITTNLTS